MVIVGVLAAQTGDRAVAGGYGLLCRPGRFPDGRRVWLGVSGLPADGVPVLGINLAQVSLLVLTLLVVWLNWGLVALFGVRLIANGLRLAYLWWCSVHRGFARIVDAGGRAAVS
ncbi:MAG: hypothetical protein H6647_06750 [Anaerolineales bacterium]|nr:hypothetical protein [Anaerolineales bacterium]